MKKAFLTVALLAAGVCFGAADDLLLTFSTKGPDRYMDGKKVLDGEIYALVWTKAGATFGGFAADGTLLSADDKLIVAAPIAKQGHCPTTLFEIDAADAGSYKDGTFGLYLVDTRIKDAKGKAIVGGFKAGATVVNAVGKAADGLSASASQSVAAAPVALAEVGVYSQLEPPAITAMEVKGAKIALTVEGMSDAADYFVVPGETPTKFLPALEAHRKGETFTFDAPENASFFKIIGAHTQFEE